jgi:pyruvate kinase
MKRTKILATLGPTTDDPEILEGMIRAGVDVVRINFSHGDVEDHRRRVAMVRQISQKVDKDVAVIGDLQGPKIRIDKFANGPVELKDGATFVLDASLGPDAGNADTVGVSYKSLPADVRPGDVLLLNDGAITLGVTSVDGEKIHCEVQTGGLLSDNKGINRLGGGLSARALTDKDLEDIEIAADLGIDYLAVSFPRDGTDIEDARRLVAEAGSGARIIAKIERADAVENLTDIIRASDAIMVARGDLGVEMGIAEVPAIQKRIIKAARFENRLTITATQMMESMVHERIPTRAEVSDVANAVIDGTDAVMLSAETAVGDYPIEVVKAMSNACKSAEKVRSVVRSRHRMNDRFDNIDEAVAMASMYVANHLDVKAIVALTESGSTPLWMSRIRSGIPVYAFTRHVATRRRVALYRGVYPISFDVINKEPDVVFNGVCAKLLHYGLARVGETIILTEGMHSGVGGETNTMKIVQVVEPD